MCTIGIVLCPFHDKVVCLGVTLNHVCYLGVEKDLWMELLQAPHRIVVYRTYCDCGTK